MSSPLSNGAHLMSLTLLSPLVMSPWQPMESRQGTGGSGWGLGCWQAMQSCSTSSQRWRSHIFHVRSSPNCAPHLCHSGISVIHVTSACICFVIFRVVERMMSRAVPVQPCLTCQCFTGREYCSYSLLPNLLTTKLSHGSKRDCAEH